MVKLKGVEELIHCKIEERSSYYQFFFFVEKILIKILLRREVYNLFEGSRGPLGTVSEDSIRVAFGEETAPSRGMRMLPSRLSRLGVAFGDYVSGVDSTFDSL